MEQNPSGIKSFLKKAAEKNGTQYDEAKADILIKTYNNDYDSIVGDIGRKVGIPEDGIQEFKKLAFEKYKIQPTSTPEIPVQNKSQAEVEALKQKYGAPSVFRSKHIDKRIEERDLPNEQQPDIDYGPFDKELVEKNPQAKRNFERWQKEQANKVDYVNTRNDILKGQTQEEQAKTISENVPTQTTIKKDDVSFAKSMLSKIDSLITNVKTPEPSEPDQYQKKYGMYGGGVDLGNKDRNIASTTKATLEKAKDYYEAVANGDSNAASKFWGGLKTIDLENTLSLGIKGMANSIDIYQASKNYSNGTATPEEENLLIAKSMLDEIQSIAQKDRATAVGSGLGEMAPWLAQFAVTGGLGTGVAKATTSIIGKSLAAKVTGRLIGSAAQTAAQIPMMGQGTAERMSDRYAVGQGGELVQSDQGEGFGEALLRTYANNYLENVSERLVGDAVDKLAFKGVKSFLNSKTFGKTKVADVINWSNKNPYFKLTNRTLGLNTPLSENIEEAFTGLTQPFVTEDNWKDIKKGVGEYYTGENLYRTFLTTAAMGAGMGGVQFPMQVYNVSQSEQGRKLVEDGFDDKAHGLFYGAATAETIEEREKYFTDLVKLTGLNKKEMNPVMHYYQTVLSQIENGIDPRRQQEIIQPETNTKTVIDPEVHNEIKVKTERQIQIDQKIKEVQDDEGNVTTVDVDGQKWYVKNSQDLGKPGWVIFIKDANGNTKPVKADKITTWNKQTPEEVKTDITNEDAFLEAEKLKQQEATQKASEKGIEVGAEVENEFGTGTVTDISKDGVITAQDEAGQISTSTIDETAPVEEIQEPEPGEVNIDELSSEDAFLELSKTDPQTAAQILQDDINEARKTAAELRKIPGKRSEKLKRYKDASFIEAEADILENKYLKNEESTEQTGKVKQAGGNKTEKGKTDTKETQKQVEGEVLELPNLVNNSKNNPEKLTESVNNLGQEVEKVPKIGQQPIVSQSGTISQTRKSSQKVEPGVEGSEQKLSTSNPITERFGIESDQNATFPNEDLLFNYIATQTGPLGQVKAIKKIADEMGVKIPYDTQEEYDSAVESVGEEQASRDIYEAFINSLNTPQNEANTPDAQNGVDSVTPTVSETRKNEQDKASIPDESKGQGVDDGLGGTVRGELDDFNFEDLFKDIPERDLTKEEDDRLEKLYQESSFSKKWAATRKEAIEKVTKQYKDAVKSKAEWLNKNYKKHGGSVEVGGKNADDYERGNVSIDHINEKRRAGAIRNAEMDMKQALEDLRLLNVPEEDIRAIKNPWKGQEQEVITPKQLNEKLQAKGELEQAKDELPELTPEQKVQRINRLLDDAKHYDKLPKNHTNKIAAAGNDLQRLANSIGYSIGKNKKGKTTVFDENKKPITRKIPIRQSQDEIQSHKALIDYPQEFQDFANFILEDIIRLNGVDLYFSGNKTASNTNTFQNAINHILNGNKTVAANNLLDDLKQIFDSGDITFTDGSGAPLNEFMAMFITEEDILWQLILNNNISKSELNELFLQYENDNANDQRDVEADGKPSIQQDGQEPVDGNEGNQPEVEPEQPKDIQVELKSQLETLQSQFKQAEIAYSSAQSKYQRLNTKLKNSPEFGNKGQAKIGGGVAGADLLNFGEDDLTIARKAVKKAKDEMDNAGAEVQRINKQIQAVKGKIGQQDMFIPESKQNQEAPINKIISASSRFKPKEMIWFDAPLVGANGAKLLGYEWKYEWTVGEDKKDGGDKDVRVSDWTQAQQSADTGRDIVHQFIVELPDGTKQTVSSESVLVLLGITDREQTKSFPSLVNAVKTLAKQKLQLSILNAQKKQYNDAFEFYSKEEKPEVSSTAPEGSASAKWEKRREGNPVSSHTRFFMGESFIDQPNKYNNTRETPYTKISTPTKETIENLTDTWIKDQINKDGITNPQYKLTELENRIERQERKVNELTKNQEAPKPVEDKPADQLPEAGKKVKQPWEMTREEYAKDTSRITDKGITKEDKSAMLKDIHRNIIQQALSEGKTIPENVKIDYPELFEGEGQPKGLNIDSTEKEVFDFFNKLKGKKVSTGTEKYKRDGEIIDVEVLNGDKISNSGVFVYFLENGEPSAEKIKVNFSNANMFTELSEPESPTVKESLPVEKPVSEDKKEQPGEKIEDFGEKIEGARKDKIKKYFDKINLNGKILSTIFPKPDIKGLLESGLSVKDVAAIKVAHEFATLDKKKGEKVIKFYAAYAKNILAESINLEFKTNNYVFTEYGKSQIELRTKAYQDVHDKLGADYLALDLTKVKIQQPDKSGRTTYFSGGEKVEDVNYIVKYYVSASKYFKGLPEAITYFTEQVKANTKVDEVIYKRKLNIYYDKRIKGEFYIGYPSKGDVIKLKEGFKTSREAFDTLKNPEILADIQTMLERILAENRQKSKPAVRLKYTNETARERVGKDWREGKDIGSEELATTFGFRAIEFGNWVNQKERQVFVNNTYDSLMDLAQLLGITPRAISLGGNLGLTFGSRGSGKAAAHYEPGRKIINLTKTQGLGSLAHEWWHGIDNYFAGFETTLKNMKAASSLEYTPEAREEIKKAFDELSKAVNNYTFKQRAKNLDGTKNAEYFSLAHEMSARAFENFTLNRLAQSGQVNDFIVNYVSNEDWNGEANKYPYPVAEESITIGAAFNNLFDTIQEKTDEEGNSVLFRIEDELPETITIRGKQKPTRNSKGNFIHPTIDGIKNFYEWFENSEAVDEQGRPIIVYSGHSNTAMFGNKFNKKNATSGGFYVSESPDIASGYAIGKIGSNEEYENGSQYRFADKKGNLTKKIWQIELTEQQKQKIDELSEQVDEYGEHKFGISFMKEWAKNNYRYDPLARSISTNPYNLLNIWQFNEMMGHNIAYNDQKSYPEQPEFELQNRNESEIIFDELGINWNSFQWSSPGVFPLYIRVTNPIDADKEFPAHLLEELEKAAKKDRTPIDNSLFGNNGMWTKDYPLKNFVEDIKRGDEYWTTQVPKKALDIFRKLGYDGYKERGDKGSTAKREERGINWVAFDAWQLKSAIANKGTYDAYNDDVLFQIIGESGAANLDKAEEATTRLDNLGVAREMEKAGKDAKAIKLATGWERGEKDNKWRYEVPDIELKFTFDEAVKNILNETLTLSDVVNDPELFKAYPELKNTKIQFYERKAFGSTGGTANSAENTIGIVLETREREIPELGGGRRYIAIFPHDGSSLKSVLSHEIQHLIQGLEGFARGGNRETVLDSIIEDRIRQLQEVLGVENLTKEQKEDVEKKVYRQYPERYRAYQQISGEVEARNVQRRIDLTPEQRRESLLTETQDVATKDQIFIYDSLGASLESEPEVKPDAKLTISDTAQSSIKEKKNTINALNALVGQFGVPITVIHSSELSKVVGMAAKRKRGTPVAFYHNGTAYIISDKIQSVSDTKQSYLHEAILHKGLDLLFNAGPVTVLGKKYNTKNELLDEVYSRLSPELISEISNKYTEGETSTKKQQREIAEEVLAKLNELEKTPSRLQVFMDSLWKFIKKLVGFSSKQFTMTDLHKMLSDHRNQVKKLARGGISESSDPKLNSAIDFFARIKDIAQTETAAFKKWFGNSKVVDKEGNPLVVYHGTNKDFSIFDPSRSTEKNNAIFFSSDPKVAQQFSEYMAFSPSIMPVFISLKNPFIIDYKGEYLSTKEIFEIVEAQNDLHKKEYDGIIIKNTIDTYKEDIVSDIYVAFSPTQIKSATGNRGTFGENDPNINFRFRSANPEVNRVIDEFNARKNETPPSKPKGTGKNKSNETEKTIVTERTYKGEFSEAIRKKLEEIGLTRKVQTQKEAEQIGLDIIEEVGIDKALEAVRSGEVKGAPAGAIFHEKLKSIDSKMNAETDPAKYDRLAKEYADITEEMGSIATLYGQYNAFFNYIYQTSDLGFNAEKMINDYKEVNNGEISPELEAKFKQLEKDFREVQNKLAQEEQKVKELEEQASIDAIKASIQRQNKKKAKASDKIRETTDKLIELIDAGKLNRPGIFMAASPASLAWDLAMDTVKTAVKATGRTIEAIAKGFEAIKSTDWYKNLDANKKKQAKNAYYDYFTKADDKKDKDEKETPTYTLTKNGLKIPHSVIRDLVEQGIDNIEDLTQAVYDVIVDDLPDITEREVRDAITGYGNIMNQNQEEIEREIRKMKDLGRAISGLEDISEGKRPQKSGLQRDKPDPDQRAIHKQVREAMKLLPVDEERKLNQQKTQLDAAKQRLINQIEDLQREIDRGELTPKNARTMQEDDELIQLRKDRDAKKAEHEALFNDEDFLNKKRVELSKKAVNRRIAELEKRIADGDFAPKVRKELIADNELIKLRAEKLRIQEEYKKEMYKAKLRNRTQAEKIKDGLWDAWNITRALRATGEFSFVGIQGLINTIAHPIQAKQAFKNATRFFSSQRKADDWINNLKSQEWYPMLKESKLAITEPNAEMTAREELFYSGWTDMIWNSMGKMIGKNTDTWINSNPMRAIERAAVGYLDTQRVLRFLDGVEMLKEKGLEFNKENKQAYVEMADVINTFTGRASIGRLDPELLTKIFFSPRNWSSVIKSATPYAFYHFGKKRAGAEAWKPSVAQKMALADYSKFVGLTASIVSLIALALNGDDDDENKVELDPRSTDFGKIKIGNIHIDPWGGRIQQVVLISRLINGNVKNSYGEVIPVGTPYKSPTKAELILQMATNKLAPSASMIYKHLSAKVDKDGNKVSTFGEPYSLPGSIKENLYPIYWETLFELAEDDITALDGLLAVYSFFGGGVNIYDNTPEKITDRKLREQTIIKSQFKEDLEAGYELTKEDSVKYNKSLLASRLKQQYVILNTRATRAEKEGNTKAAESLRQLVEDSKIKMSETDFSYEVMSPEVSRLSKVITPE